MIKKDIKINEFGDFVLDNNDVSIVTDSDLVIQCIYIALKTGLGRWKNSPAVGSSLWQYYGKCYEYSQLDQISNSIEETLNSQEVFEGGKFIVTLNSFIDNTLSLSITITYLNMILGSLNAIIDPRFNIMINKNSVNTNQEVLKQIKNPWTILNRGNTNDLY